MENNKMLELNKSISLIGNSKFGETTVKVFDAKINENDPENLTMNSYITNYELYKTNRTQALADQAEFEDAVYLIQEEMLTV